MLIAHNGNMSSALATDERPVSAISRSRRQNVRPKFDSNAVVTVFGVDIPFDGWLINAGDCGAQLQLDRSVPVYSLVKIECPDFFLLGDVVECRPEGDHWIVRVSVEHGLYGLKALADAIRESWLD
jgi:hypothetical protein